MASDSVAAGFYGKLPALGDFVGRRLGRDFVAPWDEWLQKVMSASRQQLGGGWLDAYLTSPLWRFVLAPGLCGEPARAGVLMPSCDRVGRYFPLAVVATVPSEDGLFRLSQSANGWFEAAENVLYSTPDEEVEFELSHFDRDVEALGAPTPLAAAEPVDEFGDASALLFTLGGGVSLGGAYAGIAEYLASRHMGPCSLWWTAGSEDVAPALRVCAGLPRARAFTHMIGGTGSGVAAADRSHVAAPVVRETARQPSAGPAAAPAAPAVAAASGLPAIEDAGFDDDAALLDAEPAEDWAEAGETAPQPPSQEASASEPGTVPEPTAEAGADDLAPPAAAVAIPDDADLDLAPPPGAGAIPEDIDLDLPTASTAAAQAAEATPPAADDRPQVDAAPASSRPEPPAQQAGDAAGAAGVAATLPEDLDLAPPSQPHAGLSPAAPAGAPARGADDAAGGLPAIEDAGLAGFEDDFQLPADATPAEEAPGAPAGGLPLIADAGLPGPDEDADAFLAGAGDALPEDDGEQAGRGMRRRPRPEGDGSGGGLPSIEDAGLPSDDGFAEDER